jgi:hypothetical protein
MNFPKLIHVTIKDDVPNDDPYLWVEEGGVMDAAEVGKKKRIALYKLVEVGSVIAPPSYIPPKRKGR